MPILNGLSFDVEDWFHVENLKGAISFSEWEYCDLRVVNNTRRILKILDSYDTKATFFILGWVAERCPSLVKEIAERGHEIASHGYRHELIYKQTPEEFYEDIGRSKDILESITSQPVLGYRAPSFSITSESDWALDILKNNGFAYDSSVFPTSFHNRYGNNSNGNSNERFPFRFSNGLVEMPLSTVKLAGKNIPVGGGGYFRLFPYPCFRYLCRRLNGEGKPLIFYLHPWELDHEQPRVNIRRDYRFRHYVNLEKTESRLIKLLKDFRFVPLIELVKQHFPDKHWQM
jgi:polysaccharide deacetylase family protein (PEP-CTERM system associated)